MSNVELLKQEALRLAVVVLCQGATAGKGTDKPTPEEVLKAGILFYKWFSEEN